jgi:hypothetical protein
MKFTTYDTRKRKVVNVGDIEGDTLIKNVDPSKHFMRISDSYGIQYQALGRLRDMGIKNIIIKENTGTNWLSTLRDWNDHASVADYGSGKQYFLSLKYMRREGKFEPLVKPKPLDPQCKLL